MLYIFNREEKLVAVLKNSSASSFYYERAIHTEQLNGLDLLEFICPSDHDNSELIQEGYFVGFRISGNKYKLFEIKQIEDERDGYLTKTVSCESAMQELLDDIIKDKRPTNVEAWRAVEIALEGTRWSLGKYEATAIGSTNYYYVNPLQALDSIMETWGVEITNHVEVSANKIVKRCVNVVQKVGTNRGKRFEYTKDLVTVKRTIDTTNLKTAIIPRGKGEEKLDEDGNETGGYGRRITIEDVEWKTPEHPFNKPVGQEYLEDPIARDLFGRVNEDGTRRNLFMVLELDGEEDPNILIQEAYEELIQRNVPIISYESKVLDLGDIFDHEKVSIGDTVQCIDKSFKPTLRFQARIVGIKRVLGMPEETEIVFGNILPSLAEQQTTISSLSTKVSALAATVPTRTEILENGINVDHLKGAIDVANNEIVSSNGYVTITDTEGILILDTPSYETATKALRLKGGILGISNEKDENGHFVFRTFGNGDGFTADEITTGLIRSSLIKIDGNSKFGVGYDPAKKIDVETQNIAKNGDFSLGKYGWGVDAKNFGEVISEQGLINRQNVKVITGAGKDGDSVLEVSGEQFVYGNQLIRVDANKKYKGKMRVRTTVQNSLGASNILYAGFATLGDDKTRLTGGPSTHRYFLANNKNIPVGDWVEFEATITTEGDTNDSFRNGTYWVRPVFVCNNGGNGTMQVDEFKLWVEGDPNFTQTLAAETATNLVVADSKGVIDISENALKQSSNFYWDNNGFFAINPLDSNQLLRINSGGIGISQDGGQTFKTALTGTGLVADIITTGTMLFDRMKGGSLTLGGVNNVQGQMYVLDSSGQVTVQLSGNRRGFDKLTVGTLTSPSVMSKTTQSMVFYVDVLNGSDENNGYTWATAFKTFQKAIDSTPNYLAHSVNIISHYDNNLTIDERIKVAGFHGPGKLTIDFSRLDRSQVIHGAFDINSNTAEIEIKNFSTVYANSGQECNIYVRKSACVYINNATLFGNSTARYGLYSRNSYVAIADSYIYYPTTACVISAYGSHVDLTNMKGLCDKFGVYVYTASQVASSGTIPKGNGSNAYSQLGGYLPDATKNATADAGSPSSPPAKRIIKVYSAVSADAYISGKGWSSDVKGDSYPQQGQFYGDLFTGGWFFNGNIAADMKGRTLQRVRVRMRRIAQGGYAEGSTVTIRTHNDKTKPTGYLATSGANVPAKLYWGEDSWIDISAIKINFTYGAEGVAVYVNEAADAGQTLSPNYMRLDPSLDIEFLYLEA